MQFSHCNREAKLLKLKANYNVIYLIQKFNLIVIARRSYLNWKLITTASMRSRSAGEL